MAAEPSRLPDKLELRYALRYGTLTVGHVTKTLARQPDVSYLHRSHSVPEGMARWFTSVEWHEEGRFEVVNGTVRPLQFLEYRVGADKAHRHEATFDWKAGVIHYAGWPDAKLPQNWDHFADFVRAGIAGVQEGRGSGPPPKFMIHIAKGGDKARTKEWLDRFHTYQIPYDVIGQSGKIAKNLFPGYRAAPQLVRCPRRT